MFISLRNLAKQNKKEKKNSPGQGPWTLQRVLVYAHIEMVVVMAVVVDGVAGSVAAIVNTGDGKKHTAPQTFGQFIGGGTRSPDFI